MPAHGLPERHSHAANYQSSIAIHRGGPARHRVQGRGGGRHAAAHHRANATTLEACLGAFDAAIQTAQTSKQPQPDTFTFDTSTKQCRIYPYATCTLEKAGSSGSSTTGEDLCTSFETPQRAAVRPS